MSLFQTLVLLMFNEGEEFTLEEIKLATGIGACDHIAVFSTRFCQEFVTQRPLISTLRFCPLCRGQRAAAHSAVARLRESARAHQDPKKQRRGGRRQVFMQQRLQTQTLQDQNQPDPDERDGLYLSLCFRAVPSIGIFV